MKNILKFLFAAIAVMGVFVSCDDLEKLIQDDEKLVLAVDVTEVVADGENFVTFTVTRDDVDITDLCQICSDESCLLPGDNVWIPTEEGEYTFHAVLFGEDGEPSNDVVITVLPDDGGEPGEPDEPGELDEEPEEPLVLIADLTEIVADGENFVTFTVTRDDVDITDLCQICSDESCLLPGDNVWMPTEEGEYTFHAVLFGDDGEPSNDVVITVLPDDGGEPGEPDEPGEPEEPDEPDEPDPSGWMKVADSGYDVNRPLRKNVMFITYTGSWCPPCYTFKMDLKNGGALDDRMIFVNFYSYICQPQVQSYLSHVYKAQMEVGGRFTITGYPNTFVELDQKISCSRAAVTSAFSQYVANPARTGIKVESESGGNGHSVDFTVTVAAQTAGEYSVGAFLIEDNVIAFQDTDYRPQEAADIPIGIADFNHTGVLREESMQDIFGDDIGAMAAGDVKSKSFKFDARLRDNRIPNQTYNSSNLSLVVYTMYLKNGKKVVANSVKVPVNGTTGFAYAN